MPSSCRELREAVIDCLRSSDCIAKGYTPAECIRMPLKETLTPECRQLLHAYGECKRRNIDMRYRFRGNNPVGTSQELQGGSATGESTPQLYGGRPALPSVKGTDGNEDQKKD